MSTVDVWSDRRDLRVMAKRALQRHIHTMRSADMEQSAAHEAECLIARLFDCDTYQITLRTSGRCFQRYHNDIDDSTEVDRILQSIATHGLPMFLLHWYKRKQQ